MFNKIPIRLYYDSNGDLYTYGNLNVMPTLHRLSNYAYELYVVCPFANENNTMYFNYQKSDGTQNTTPVPMAYFGRENVKVVVNNEEVTQSWYKYVATLEDNVLSISTPNHANTLLISPNITYYTITGYNSLDNTTTTITNVLNFAPQTLACIYALSNNDVYVEDTPLETIIAYINTALGFKVDKVKGIQVIPTLLGETIPTPTANDLYKAYILRSQLTYSGTTYSAGDIIVVTPSSTTPTTYGYTLLSKGWLNVKAYIDANDLLKVDKLTADEVGEGETKAYIAYDNDGDVEQGSIKLVDDIDDIGEGESAIPKYSATQTLQTATPTSNYEVANKLYVDTQVAQSIAKINTIYKTHDVSGLAVGQIFILDEATTIDGVAYAKGTILIKTANGYETLGYSKTYIDLTTNSLQQSITANANNITTLQANKLDKVYGSLPVANSIADSDKFVINSGGVPYQISFSTFKGGDNHYKGDFVSLQALQQAYPTAQAGDYAFVNNGNDLVMYVWDTDYQTTGGWRETTTGQYVKSTTFATYQQNIIDGTTIVGKAKDYDTTSGGIKTKFDNIESQINGKQSALTAGDGIDETQLASNIIAVDSTIATESYVDGLVANKQDILTSASGSGITLVDNAQTHRTAISVDTNTIATKSSVDTLNTYAHNVGNDLADLELTVDDLGGEVENAKEDIELLKSGKQATVGFTSSSGYLTSITLGTTTSPSILNIERPDVNKAYVDAQVATKSTVSASTSGSTSTTAKYLTINGTEWKLPDGKIYTAGTGMYINNYTNIISNTISYEQVYTYSITYNLTHCSIASVVEGNKDTIETNGYVYMYMVADDGYTLPENITVTGATINGWDESTGQLSFQNPTNNVVVTITAEQEPTGIAMNWSTSPARGTTPKLKVTRGGTEIINHTGRGLSGTDQVEVGDVIYVSGGSDIGGSYVKADGVEVYRTYDYGSYTVQQGVNVLTVWVDGGLA